MTFWVALAVTQSRLGRLQASVRDRAVQLIDAGGDLARWELDNPKLAPRRAVAIAKARDQPRRRRPPKVYSTSLRPGQVLTYTSSTNAIVLLRVARIEVNRWSTGPVLQALDYGGSRLPGRWHLRRLADRSRPSQPPGRGQPGWEPPWNCCTFYATRV